MFCVCFCSFGYPACNAQAPYCHLWSVRLYNIFPHYLINSTIFEGKKRYWTQNVCSRVSLQLLPETFFILRRTGRDIVKNIYRCSGKVPVILGRFQWNLNFLGKFSKNTQLSNFMTIRPVGTELFHADRRADGRKWRSQYNFS